MHLTDKQRVKRLEYLNNGWKIENQLLVRSFEFKDFIHAFEFLKRVAEISEKNNHHPHIYNSYNKVVIKLITHDLDSISSKDFDLALEIDKIK